MFADARADPAFQKDLEDAYLEEDMETSFRRCIASTAPTAVLSLLQRLGVDGNAKIADVGAGRAHFAYAMSRLSALNITVMEPNDNWYTGTGYLRSLGDHDIEIVNSVDDWRKITCRFDAIISYANVHHWQHIPKVMIDLRRALKPGRYWLMCSEFFANTPDALLGAMHSHATARRYNCYEWPYPASVYADLAASVGLELAGVIPQHYRGNEFLVHHSPAKIDHRDLDVFVDMNLLSGTVDAFWDEVDFFRRARKGKRYYTLPQVMVFRRVSPD